MNRLPQLTCYTRSLSSGALLDASGDQVVTVDLDHAVHIWDATTGAQNVVLRGHADVVTGAALFPCMNKMLTISADGVACVWDLVTGSELIRQGHKSSIAAAMVFPDGSRILTCSQDGIALVWDAIKGQEMMCLKGHTSAILGCHQGSGNDVL